MLPDRVSILAEIGERAEDIDVQRAEKARDRAAERMKAIRDEAGFEEARSAYVRAVTRLAVARKVPRAERLGTPVAAGASSVPCSHSSGSCSGTGS